MTELVKYDAACRAIAEAKSLDEAKDIRDKSIAMAAYARQAKNKDLEADAVEIRMRAERRLGQMLGEHKRTIGLNEGGRPVKTPASAEGVSKAKLVEVGIGTKSGTNPDFVVAENRIGVHRDRPGKRIDSREIIDRAPSLAG